MYVPGWWQVSAVNLSQQKKAALSNMYVENDITLIVYISNYSQFMSEGVGFIQSLFFPKFKTVHIILGEVGE